MVQTKHFRNGNQGIIRVRLYGLSVAKRGEGLVVTFNKLPHFQKKFTSIYSVLVVSWSWTYWKVVNIKRNILDTDMGLEDTILKAGLHGSHPSATLDIHWKYSSHLCTESMRLQRWYDANSRRYWSHWRFAVKILLSFSIRFCLRKYMPICSLSSLNRTLSKVHGTVMWSQLYKSMTTL